ncbi:MAG: ABC transporter substrate-binding protein [Coprobacillaceae bacterium]
MKKILSLLAVGILGLSGCGAAVEETPESISITFEATGDMPAKYEEMFSRYTEQTGIEVDLLPVVGSDAYKQSILSGAASNSLPDIIWTNSGAELREYVDNGVVINIDDYMTRDLANYQESILSGFYVDDSLYGLPSDYNSTALYYDETVFDGDISTYSDYKSALESYAKDTGQAGLGIDPKLNYIYPFYLSAGLSLVDDSGQPDLDAINSDLHMTVLTEINDLFEQGLATTPYITGAGWDGELLQDGTVPSLYGGTWVQGVIQSENIKATELPIVNTENAMLYTAGYAVTSSSEYPQAAVDLIEYMTSDDEVMYSYENGLISLPSTLSGQEILNENKPDDEFLPVYYKAAEAGYDFNTIDPEFLDLYNKQIENLIYGEATPEEVVEKLNKEIEE